MIPSIEYYINKYNMNKNEAEWFKERVSIKVVSGLMDEDEAIVQSMRMLLDKREEK